MIKQRHFELEGYFSIKVTNTITGEERLHQFKNLITNTGLNLLGTRTFIAEAVVGAGNTPPTESDTALVAQVARATSYSGDRHVASTSAPYYSDYSRTWRFAEGTAAGNLSEVGVGATVSGQYRLFSRALIKDTEGNPITITVLSNEVLDVTYTLRTYHMVGEVVIPDVQLLGRGYTFRVKAANALNKIGNVGLKGGYPNVFSIVDVFTGPWADVTGVPSSGMLTRHSAPLTIHPYVTDSYKLQATVSWTLTEGNSSAGISSFRTWSDGDGFWPQFQMMVEPPIPKTSAMSFSLVLEVSWGRYSGPA